eukprot:TRINITY_DN4055_c0_g1_i2.p1 TRINITY_DN4055_c0_g1~~TRINITY_DN4055_c0_g1_i2.p1  ORF type:complete len:299 (+),score=56.25 TRINITY_DN4055_c0_g1_i2:93-989(+)
MQVDKVTASPKSLQICGIPLNLQDWMHFETYQEESSVLIQAASRGLRVYEPQLNSSGEGGSYLIRDENNNLIGVFKPFDEDPFSVRNPKLVNLAVNSSFHHSSHRPGEAAYKEVAAYLLDHQHKAGVPLTILVKIFGSRWGIKGKLGSLQRYESHDHDSWELGPSLYQKTDVHHIAMLDLRLINTDRHGGNILVRRYEKKEGGSGLKLIPIDHGFCLPNSLPEDLWFEWMSWPQAKEQLDVDIQRYLLNMDLEEDVSLLRGLGLQEEIIQNMLMSSAFVQQGVLRGFTPVATGRRSSA